MNIIKFQKIFKLIVIVLVIYSIYNFINQQAKISEYDHEIKMYQDQIATLNEQKTDLETTKANINSQEYIENMARENLDMYRPNERVYIDVSR